MAPIEHSLHHYWLTAAAHLCAQTLFVFAWRGQTLFVLAWRGTDGLSLLTPVPASLASLFSQCPQTLTQKSTLRSHRETTAYFPTESTTRLANSRTTWSEIENASSSLRRCQCDARCFRLCRAVFSARSSCGMPRTVGAGNGRTVQCNFETGSLLSALTSYERHVCTPRAAPGSPFRPCFGLAVIFCSAT